MSVSNPTLLHRLEAIPLQVIALVAQWIPLRWISPCGAVLGRFAFHVLRIKRRMALNNLALALGDRYSPSERRALAIQCYESFGTLALEVLKMPRVTHAQVSRLVTLENEQVLRDALARGKGVLLITGHFGNWEIMTSALPALGIPLSVYVGRQHNPIVDNLINGIRRKGGAESVHKSVVMKGFLKALKANRGMGILADQHDTHNRHFVSFFGSPVSAAPGPASIARRTGSPIVFFFTVRQGPFRFRSVFQPVPFAVTDNAERDVLEITQSLYDHLEAAIREHPEQYFWMHNRWRPGSLQHEVSETNHAFLAERLPPALLPPVQTDSPRPADAEKQPAPSGNGPESTEHSS